MSYTDLKYKLSNIKNLDITAIFEWVVETIFKILLFFVLIALIVGLIKLFSGLNVLFTGETIIESYGSIITDILTFFVVLELFKSLFDYFENHQLKLTFIVDSAIVFILREVMINLYKHKLDPMETISIAVLLLVLGLMRTAAVVYSPIEKKIIKEVEQDYKRGLLQAYMAEQRASRFYQYAFEGEFEPGRH
ncbi:MAG: phosphate-starvation-inducible PsiE family protein [Thermodesulfobacteriota bacterium]